jgi:NADH-quinone oxidoreductase subunit M
VILTAGYLLWAWQRVYFGTNPATQSFPEATPREAAVLLPFAILAILLGIWPALIMKWMDPSIAGWVANLAVLKL